jgi:hypothetical protein
VHRPKVAGENPRAHIHRIQTIDEYVQRRKNDFALETSNWDEKSQEEYKEMVEILFNKKQGRIFDPSNERLYDIAYELFDTFRISESFPKFIREMSLVYLISKFEGFLSKNLEILFTRKPDTMFRKDKKASFETIFKSKNMDEILERVVQDEVSIIFRKEIEDLNKDYMEFAKFDLSKNTDWKNFKEFFLSA